jgi:hypothetical protein
MLKYYERKKLKSISKRLLVLSNKLSCGTLALTPLNYSEEKFKFLHSSTYNPQFIYHTLSLKKIKDTLQDIEKTVHFAYFPSDVKDYLYEYITDLKREIRMQESIGTQEFGSSMAKLFNFDHLNPQAFLSHMQNIPFYEVKDKKLHNAHEIKAIFDTFISENNIGHEVVIDTFNDHIVRVEKNKVVIGAAVKRFCHNVQRLLVHEVESHVLQRASMQYTQNPIVRLMKHQDSVLWGEGLAVYNELHSGTITRDAFETYYYRLKAVSMIHKSFRDIFEFLANHMKAEKAYLMTYRVKRGMQNTENPGGNPKDACYALGYERVREYIEGDGSIELLYMSRVPHIGELLLNNDLLEQGSIYLPEYLKKNITKSKHQSLETTHQLP